jgi:hypothetical protein
MWLMLVLLASPDAGVVAWDERSAVKLVEGQVMTLGLKAPPSRIAASDPSACEVTSSGPSTLVLKAKKPGVTTVALWYGYAPKGLQVEVSAKPSLAVPDAGLPFFTWDGTQGLTVPRDRAFVVQGPGGLEKVAPGSHRRCAMTSIGNDQLELRCAEAGPVSVFLWYANNRRRTLELDVVAEGPSPAR